MIRLALAGATGRMGRCVLDLVSRDESWKIAAALARPDDPHRGATLRLGSADINIVDRLDSPCDVLIDFTVASGTMQWLEVCERRSMPMVIGATGHDDNQLARIGEAAHMIPIVKAANFSVGVSAILGLVSRLVKELGDDYDIELVETHHRQKVDAPSGTALAMLDEVLRATGKDRNRDVVFGRSGQTGERPKGQIGMHSVRMGQIIGKHQLHFSGPAETLSIEHTVHSRETFAAGALRAADWIVSQPPGLYTMRDVMGHETTAD